MLKILLTLLIEFIFLVLYSALTGKFVEKAYKNNIGLGFAVLIIVIAIGAVIGTGVMFLSFYHDIL